MSQRISAHIAEQRKTIRRTQLNNTFLNKRILMVDLNINQAIQMLQPHLQVLQEFAVYESNTLFLKKGLQKLRQIISQFDLFKYLSQPINFSTSKLIEMKLGKTYKEMTWADLILNLLNSFKEDFEISESCSYILSKCAQQFINKERKRNCFESCNKFDLQFKRLYENYPYDMILEGNCETIQNSLAFISQVALKCVDGSAIYTLVNRLNPNIVIMLNSLMEKSHLMEMESVWKEFSRAAEILVYYITRFNYISFEVGQLKFLVEKLKLNLMCLLRTSPTKQIFGRSCQQLRCLVHSKLVNFERSQLEQIQKMMSREIENMHEPYFLMVKAMMNEIMWNLHSESIKLILTHLFDQENKDIHFKHILLVLLNKHVINCGNRFRIEDAEIFISNWGQFSKVDRLIIFLTEIQNSEEGDQVEQQFSCLLSKLGMSLDSNIMNFVDAHEDQYEQLMRFQAFHKNVDSNLVCQL